LGVIASFFRLTLLHAVRYPGLLLRTLQVNRSPQMLSKTTIASDL
jgi:hypothetical protein